MLINNFKIALRNFIKNKFNSTINIVGLSVGICAVLLIYIYVSFELSYDNFHENENKLFRVSVISTIKGKTDSDSHVFLEPLGPAIKKEIPEVEQYTRVSAAKSGIITYKDKNIKTEEIRFADSTFFSLFSFKLVVGDINGVLKNPSTAVVTEATAKTFFGKENPIGKLITFDGNQYEITGIAKNPPLNTHLKFNVLLSFESLYSNPNVYLGWNGGNQYITYLKLKKGNLRQSVDKKLEPLMWEYLNKDVKSFGWKYNAYLQPVKDIHLYYDDANRTRLSNIKVFSIIALFVLLIACINYINLTLAQSIKRSREIGIKKVFGASRFLLAKQFMIESLITISISAVLAFLIFLLIAPIYKEFVGEYFGTNLFINMQSIIIFIMMIILISFLSSFYPAFYLSKMSPIKAIQDGLLQRSSKFNLRNALIIVQFVISIGLISATFIITNQIDFIKNRDVGFKKDNLIVISLTGAESSRECRLLKNELIKIPGVKSVSATSGVPIGGLTSNGYIPEGFDSPSIINVLDADENFLETYGIKLISGRNFSGNSGEAEDSYLVNEEFVKQYMWENPIGKTIVRNGKHNVIGVVSNFNFSTAYEKIAPLIITNNPESKKFYYISIKANPAGIARTIEEMKDILQTKNFGIVPEYFFIDEAVGLLYKDEMNFRTLFLFFSSLSIFLALMGLLGLVSFSLTQKKKEIGIRKVLGSSITNIIFLIYKEYSLLVFIAFITACLPTLYFMNRWLEDFAYRVEISIWLFAIAGAIVLMITLLTISSQAIRAAFTNPTESLRSE